jgi:hypothetical protein
MRAPFIQGRNGGRLRQASTATSECEAGHTFSIQIMCKFTWQRRERGAARGEVMAWIKVTDPLGHPVWLSVEQIVRIRPYMAGIDFPAPAPDGRTPHDHKDGDIALAAAKSIVDLVSGVQAVRETQDDVIERIRNAQKEDDKDKTAGV